MKQRGFTLIELIIALVIVGILISLGIPSYQDYVTRVRRSDGQTALLDLAARMERYYAENNAYTGATLDDLGAASSSSEGYYTLSITSANATTFTLAATPTGAQSSDTTCSTLTYNQLGQKGNTGTGSVADCWG